MILGTSPNGSRERPPAGRFGSVSAMSGLSCCEELSRWSQVMNAQAADMWVTEVVILEKQERQCLVIWYNRTVTC